MTELNLIPYRLREQRRKKFHRRQYISVGIIVFCVLFFGIYFPMGTLMSLQSHESALKLQIDSQQSIIQENHKLKEKTDQLKHYIDQVAQLDFDDNAATKEIKGLEAYVPQGIRFLWINYGESELSLEGVTSNYSEISELTANLQMSDNYRSAVITEIKLDEANSQYHFLVSLKQGGTKDEKSE